MGTINENTNVQKQYTYLQFSIGMWVYLYSLV